MTEASASHRIDELLDRLDALGHGEPGPPPCEEAATACERAEAALSQLQAEERDDAGTGALEDHLAQALESLENDTRAVLADTSLPPERLADLIPVLRARASLLHRLARDAHGRPRRDELPFVRTEVRELATHLDSGKSSEELDSLRLETETTRAGHLVARSFGIDPEHDAPSSVRAFRLARAMGFATRALRGEIDSAGERAGPASRDLATGLVEEKNRLHEGCLKRFAEARTPEEIDAALTAASRLRDELDETRVGLLEEETGHTDVEVRALLDEARDLDQSLQKARSAAPDPSQARRLETGSRRLRRMSRRLADASADRVLRRRLDRVFGSRTVRVWEAIVFWLIVSILGLILVEHYGEIEGTSSTIPWTVWVDTGICAVLLLDFTTRLTLTPRRGRYFLRNFLTELLPSLPFGLLASLGQGAGIRSVRVLRLVRVFRVLQVLRPFIRFLRLLLFVLRALDRVVERNAWILNRNIVFFAETPREKEAPALLGRARELSSWIQHETQRMIRDLPPAERTRAVRLRATLLRETVRYCEAGVDAFEGEHSQPLAIETDVEDVIRALRKLDASSVADAVGVDFARQVDASLRFFRLPLLRRLPVVRFVVGPTGAPDPLGVTARLGRVLGDMLDGARRVITWFGDLHGTITGSQFLDRMGLQLVKATARPTKRLVIFLVLAALLYGFVHLLRLDFLATVLSTTFRFLSLPVFVLGIACILPLLLGLWFRRIAGQAVDFFERVAEAQFLALTETAKHDHADRELETIADRVLLPEARLRVALTEADEARLRAQTRSRAEGRDLDPPDPPDPLLDWSRCDAMLLFYREYVDGAWFHENDTKIANFVLGNLALENIRENRLRMTPRQRRRIERLDVARGKGGLFGATPWFRFITHAIALKTARLILEYNQHCIPVDERSNAHEEDRRLFEDWLAQREEVSKLRRAGRPTRLEGELRGTGGTLVYRSTEFNALHFLTVDPDRDDAVQRRYGDRVLELLREDRAHLVREVFGTFPMHRIPEERRTFNPYEMYGRFVARGRAFLLPLVAIALAFRGVRYLIGRTIAIVRDVLHPESRVVAVTDAEASFRAARRKLHRMRRPVVLESIRLRARFDPEYLGLAIPGREPTVSVPHQLSEDLRRLDATEREWEEFRQLRSRRERQLRVLAEILGRLGLTGDALDDEIRRRNPELRGRSGEAVRAMALAFVCDTDRVWTLAEARTALADRAQSLVEPPAEKVGKRPRGRGVAAREDVRGQLASVKPLIGAELDAEALTRLEDSLVYGTREDAKHLEQLASGAAALSPEAFDRKVADAVLSEAIRPSTWTEQILAVRTVQTLAMLDLSGYEEALARLGAYEDVPEGLSDAAALSTDSSGMA